MSATVVNENWNNVGSPLHRGVAVITTAQLQSTNPELRFSAGSNSACSVSEICNGDDP